MIKEIKDFLFKDEDIDWFIYKSGLPWLNLDINVPYKEIYSEANNIIDKFIEYRETNSRGWKGICLHGISSEHIYDYTTYLEYKNIEQKDVPYRFTEISDLCPITTRFLKTSFFNIKFFRVRFMLLEPGGYILPHTDMPTKLLAPINIAINNPNKCVFKMKGYGIVPFSPGRVFMLDTSNEHIVYNGSDESRIHMIVHCDYLNLSTKDKNKWSDLINTSLHKTLNF